tara:strand:- start:484 stop:891 length:408 start_codon:yes stop_codon:yes gene_type:complete
MTTHWDEVVNQTSIIFSIGCLILSVLYGFGVLSIRKPNFSEITIAEFETEVPQSTVVITSLEPEPKSKPKHKTAPKKKKVKKKKKPSKLQQDCILTLTSLGEKKTQAKKIVDNIFKNNTITSLEHFLGVVYANPK